MNEFVTFLREHWFQLAAFVGFIIEIIFIFIKRRPKSVDELILAFKEVEALLPSLINAVEEPGNGTLKKSKVLASSISLLEHKIGRKLTTAESANFVDKFDAAIELILTTPTKKGEIDEK